MRQVMKGEIFKKVAKTFFSSDEQSQLSLMMSWGYSHVVLAKRKTHELKKIFLIAFTNFSKNKRAVLLSFASKK